MKAMLLIHQPVKNPHHSKLDVVCSWAVVFESSCFVLDGLQIMELVNLCNVLLEQCNSCVYEDSVCL